MRIIGFLLIILCRFFFHPCEGMKGQKSVIKDTLSSITIINDTINNQLYLNKLPSLKMLIDSAINYSSLIKQHNSMVKNKDLQYQLSKTNWLKNIGFYVEGRYGKNDYLSYQNLDPDLSDPSRPTTRYNISARIGFSVFDLVNRNRLNKIAKEELDESIFIKEGSEKQVKEKVIQLYSELEFLNTLIDIKVKAKEAHDINLQIAKKQLSDSEINISEYTSIMNTVYSADVDLEETIMHFKLTYFLLEELIGKKLNEF